MSKISFSHHEKSEIVAMIKTYFNEELDQDIGQFDAEFLLDFFAQKIGFRYYNQGLYDAKALLETKVHDLGEALYELEQVED